MGCPTAKGALVRAELPPPKGSLGQEEGGLGVVAFNLYIVRYSEKVTWDRQQFLVLRKHC